MKKILKSVLTILLAFSVLIGSSPIQFLSESYIKANALTPYGTVSSAYASSSYYTKLCNVSLTGNQRTDILNVAWSQYGYHEGNSNSELGGNNSGGSGNYTEYGRVIGSNPNEWCAYFVSWCARQAGISTSILKNSACAGHSSAYFNLKYYAGGSQASDGGYFMGNYYTPQPGDLFFTSGWTHVGLVASVSGSTFTTIEGNSSNSVTSHTYYISDYYFGVPEYEDNSVQRDTKIALWASANGGNGVPYYNCPEVTYGTTQNKYYIWYKIYDANTGDLYNTYANDSYTVTVSIRYSDGTIRYSSSPRSNDDNSWIGVVLEKADTYTINVTIPEWNVDFSRTFVVGYDADLIANKSSVTLDLQGTNSSTITFTPSGSYPGEYGVSVDYDEDYIGYDSFYRDGYTSYLTIYGIKPGTKQITASLYEKYTGNKNVVATLTINVTISGPSYTLSYNANGGTGTPSSQTGGSEYAIPYEMPTRTGYTFDGWAKSSSASNGSYFPLDEITLSSNTTLYAVWKPATTIYTGTTTVSPAFRNQTVCYKFTPSVSGTYKFTGVVSTGSNSVTGLENRLYLYNSSGNCLINTASSSTSEADFTYNLVAGNNYYFTTQQYSVLMLSQNYDVSIELVSASSYTLSYNANGGSSAPSDQTGATSYTISSTVPTRFGYNFIGWSKSSSATSATYESGDTITLTSDTTLYAVWSQPQISVNSSATANITGGGQVYYFKLSPSSGASYVIYSTGDSDTKAFLYDSDGNEVENNDDGGDNRNFRICRNLTGGSDYILAVKYYSSSTTGNIPVKFGYAYGVYYYANGGSGAPDDQVKDYGKNLTLSTTVPTRNGYTFLGWSTSSSATTATYSPGDVYSSNSTAYLYAVWEEAKYDLIYDGNGYSSYNSSVFGIVTTTINTTLPNRKGYTFLGWSKDRNATSATYKPGDSITLTADTTLYAVWKSATAISENNNITTTIDFAGQEVYYTFTPSSSGEYTFESSGSLDSKVSLYSSSGTEIGSDDDSSENGTNFKLTKSLTSGTKYYVMVSAYNGNTGTTTFVVAKETPATYTLTYNANGGSGAPSSQTGATSYTISSTVPTRFGYTFLGWSKSSSATSATYEPGDSINLSSSITLYAVWKSAATISANTNISTSVSFANQEVYYTFTPSSSGDYTFESSGSLDSKIYLYSSPGTELGYDDDSSENGNNFMLTESLTANSKYYIKIRAYDSYTGSTSFTITQETSATYTLSYNANGGSGAPSSNTGATSYTISSTIPTRFGHTFLGWSKSSSATSATYESGDSISLSSDTTLYAVWRSVNSISLDYSLSVPITTAGQEQLVKFVPDSSKSYTIESSGSDDTYVYLYDEDGNRISYNDDGGDNQNFSLSYDLVAGETYYYGIKFYDSTKTGTISVSLNADNSSIAKGDVNSDGYVDATDASLIARYDAGYVTLTSAQLAVADVNKDGYVDATDASLIARYDAGYISEI